MFQFRKQGYIETPAWGSITNIMTIVMFLSHFLCSHVPVLKPESNSFLLVLNLGYVFAAAALCMQGLHCMMAPFKKKQDFLRTL